MKAPLVKLPANDVGDPKVIEIAGEPKQFVKLLALGMLSGGMHVIQHLRGRPPAATAAGSCAGERHHDR